MADMAATFRLVRVAVLLLMTQTSPAAAQTAAPATSGAGQPIRYTVSFSAPHTHYLEVSAAVPTGGRREVELMMAVWTPGSYLVREFSRHVEGVTARGQDGRPIAIEKSDKNRWRVATGGGDTVTVSYRVYAREMSVRTNWVEAGFALINGAPTFLTLADDTRRPHEVVIVPATGWRRSMTGLPSLPGGDHRYRAPDFDTLVDSPILVGNPAVYEFTVDGKPHYLVNEGEGGIFDGARAAKDLEAIVREHRRMWGSLPYDRYLFLNVINEAGGGLEHLNSTVLMTTRWATRTRRNYVAWLDLASHEFFHVWNVKRLRPVELGPFDYENEVHTRSLWVAEGITDYYADLAVHRAGLTTREEYLDSLSDKIEELQTTPGREVQSAELASFDAWIKYYRPDENSANTSISYYTKGAVIAFVLDGRIRKATNGAKSLDDVMRAAYEKFSGTRGFTPDEFRAVAQQVAGVDLTPFWHTAIEGTGELDYAEALDTFGLRFRPAPAGRARAWLGMTTRNDAGRLLVSQVRRSTPAMSAGLNVDDEIVAVDDYRVRADRWDARLDQYQPGDKVTLTIARREQMMKLDLTFGSEPPRQWRIEVTSMTDAQKGRQAAWLQPKG
jgi:predicted metalloprotease with PDZ domain